jgi:hypothetical protein
MRLHPFQGQSVWETGEKPEKGLRLMKYYSRTTKKNFQKNSANSTKNASLFKKKYKNRLATLIKIHF